jgi:MYXO-CTERM domain-containing protein
VKRAALVALLVAAVTSTAWAYVRSRTPKGIPVAWASGCAYVTPDSAATPDMPADQVFAVIQKSIANWQNAVGSQAYLKLIYQTPMPLEAHLDGINTVKFRSDRWCHPNDAQQNNVCYSAQAAGITTVFYVQDGDKAGTILDADIELNDVNYTFAVLPTTAPADMTRPFVDLENTLTHELGHFQGLDHTCQDGNLPTQEVDENGNPPPLCDKLYLLPPAEQQTITQATMYNFAMSGETIKRMPKPDDVAGIVAAYPPANDPHSCKPVNLDDYKSRGCSMGGPAPHPLGAVAVLLGVMVALVLRRRRT